MSTHVKRRRAYSGAGQSTPRVLLVSGVFAGVLATGWLIDRILVPPSPAVPAGIYRGVVQLAPDTEGRCEQFEYDNKTEWMGATRSTWCETALPSQLPGSSLGRLHGISDHFK